MGLGDVTPRIEALRRSQKTLDKQVKARTAELEKVVESLRAEIALHKRAEDLVEPRVQERTAELQKANDALLVEIAECRQTNEMLREAERRYHCMADAMPILVWQSGPDGLRTYFNQRWLRFTGRTPEQEVGNGWMEGVHPDNFQRCLDSYVAAFDRREPFSIEYRLRHCSGGYRWVLDHGLPQFSSDGTFLGYVGGAIDTHDRRLAEQALHKSRRLAVQALHKSGEKLRMLAARLQAVREEERTQLAREIHDELSGTLTALKMDISLLPDRAAKDRKLFLEKLSSMSELIDRTLTRVHAIVTELRPVVLDKFGLVAAIEWQAGEFQNRSGIACETHLPSEDISLNPDRSSAVFRILQEALTNVARHANATKVVVDLRSEAGNLILTVRDNGKGIDAKAIYAHNSIGLLGMRERALSFGGTAEVSRFATGGTLVSVRIPLIDASPRQ